MSTVIGGVTSSQLTEFDDMITMQDDARESPDGTVLMHAPSMKRHGLETDLDDLPAPARDNLSVHVATERDSSIKLTLRDHRGRVLDTVQDRNLEDTVKNVAFDLRLYAIGTSFCLALTATGAKNVPIVVLRPEVCGAAISALAVHFSPYLSSLCSQRSHLLHVGCVSALLP
jgi:hypothetical protein